MWAIRIKKSMQDEVMKAFNVPEGHIWVYCGLCGLFFETIENRTLFKSREHAEKYLSDITEEVVEVLDENAVEVEHIRFVLELKEAHDE